MGGMGNVHYGNTQTKIDIISTCFTFLDTFYLILIYYISVAWRILFFWRIAGILVGDLFQGTFVCDDTQGNTTVWIFYTHSPLRVITYHLFSKIALLPQAIP